MSWLSTDSMSKLPKDWQPPPKPSEDIPGYVEVKEIQKRADTVILIFKFFGEGKNERVSFRSKVFSLGLSIAFSCILVDKMPEILIDSFFMHTGG